MQDLIICITEMTEPGPSGNGHRATPEPSASSSGSATHQSSSNSVSVQIARIIGQEAERRYLNRNAELLSTGTHSQKRTVRYHARRTGQRARARALQQALRVTGTEMQSLRAMLSTQISNRQMLITQLQAYGFFVYP